MRYLGAIGALLACCVTAYADFSWEDTGGALILREGGEPVLHYNYEPVEPPDGVDEARYTRACYVHPLFATDGSVVTQDFPSDHYHHRGVFWGWPKDTTVGNRSIDVWSLDGVRPHLVQWLGKTAEAGKARLGVENEWRFDGESAGVIKETVWIDAHPAEADGRFVDFELTFQNVATEPVTFLGAESKGYGGFNFRPDAGNKPFTFTAQDGVVENDKLSYETAWADISWKQADGAAGVAIFQHPSNPDYPHHGWIFRHYGFLGACWPHLDPHTIQPGEGFTLRYRVFVHEGDAEKARVAERFAHYRDAPDAENR